jgi:hypothetical protein
MLEFLFVLMSQAAAGAPAASPPPASPAAVTQPAGAPAAQSQRPATDIRDVVRCRRIITTGSRIAGTRCTSLRTDAEQRENARVQTDAIQDMGRVQICQAPPCN